MRTKTDMSVEQRRRVTLGVLQRIHVALASIESHRLNGDSHDGWPSRQAMDVDYTVLEEMKKLVCNGENLATTQHSRLFVMRELVLANANCILPDSDYILSEKGAWFSCGAVSIRLREARDGVERKMIAATIDRHKGNIVKAAEELGVSRPTIYDLMKKHGLTPLISTEKTLDLVP